MEENLVTLGFRLAVAKRWNEDFCINLANVIEIHEKHKPGLDITSHFCKCIT